MDLDVFCELQPGREPDGPEAAALLAETIEQAQLADEQGFGCWWTVEHHSAPDFSISSAPDLMLAVLSQHTRRMRLGTAGILSPFEINHPVRVAERAAFVDVLSGGRLDLGLARSGGAEWEAFGVDPESTREQMRQAFRMLPQIWTGEEFEWQSELLRVPPRCFAPRPIQQPHPPLWQTVSGPESCEGAGQLGVGMLASACLAPLDHVVRSLEFYDRGLAACEEPVGATINDQRAIFVLFHCAESREAAIASGAGEAALWFMNTAPRIFRVDRTNWLNIVRGVMTGEATTAILEGEEDGPSEAELEDPVPVIRLMNRQRAGLPLDPAEVQAALDPIPTAVIGDVEDCRAKLQAIAGTGVDRLMCLMQFGELPHARVLESIRNAGKYLIPELHS